MILKLIKFNERIFLWLIWLILEKVNVNIPREMNQNQNINQTYNHEIQ